MPDYNIANRFGPLHRTNFATFWRGFVAQLFGFDSSPPSTANLRASRSWSASTRIIPLSYLDAVALPGDYPRVSGDPAITDEVELQALYESHFPLGDLDVRLPASGAPVISDAVTQGVARADLCRLAAARAIGLDEIAVRILYV